MCVCGDVKTWVSLFEGTLRWLGLKENFKRKPTSLRSTLQKNWKMGGPKALAVHRGKFSKQVRWRQFLSKFSKQVLGASSLSKFSYQVSPSKFL